MLLLKSFSESDLSLLLVCVIQRPLSPSDWDQTAFIFFLPTASSLVLHIGVLLARSPLSRQRFADRTMLRRQSRDLSQQHQQRQEIKKIHWERKQLHVEKIAALRGGGARFEGWWWFLEGGGWRVVTVFRSMSCFISLSSLSLNFITQCLCTLSRAVQTSCGWRSVELLWNLLQVSLWLFLIICDHFLSNYVFD